MVDDNGINELFLAHSGFFHLLYKLTTFLPVTVILSSADFNVVFSNEASNDTINLLLMQERLGANHTIIRLLKYSSGMKSVL